MDKNDCVRKLTALLEPLIETLEDNKKILSERKNELEKVSRLIAYTKDNVGMVGIYADQDLIISYLNRLNYNKDDYKASCYLLKSENDKVKALPQYEKAYNLISDIIECFKLHKAELIVEIERLSDVCKKQELEKKYYDILSCPNPLVEDISEFVDFMKAHGQTDDIIIEILYKTIHDNMINYELKSN